MPLLNFIMQIKSSKLTSSLLQASSTTTAGSSSSSSGNISAPKKRSFQDMFSSDPVPDQDSEASQPPKKRPSTLPSGAGEGLESEPPSSSADARDIQELLESTKRQIEEKKRQTQSLLAKQGLLQTPSPATPQLPVRRALLAVLVSLLDYL